jgi:predicted PurR-regulated permease PerM
MSGNDWMSKVQWLKGVVEKPAGKAYSMISSFLPRSGGEPPETSMAIVSLMGAVLWADGALQEKEIDEFRSILSRTHSPEMVDYFVRSLKNFKGADITRESALIKHLPDPEKLKIIVALLKLSWVDNEYHESQRKMIAQIAVNLDINEATLKQMETDVAKDHESRRRILKSGAGIIVALIVITIFILTATFLKSVIFGLILAYIFLPLEKWYEKQFTSNSFFIKLFGLGASIVSPLKTIAAKLRSRRETVELSPLEKEKKRRQALIGKATAATVSTFILICFMLGIVFVTLSASYVAGLSASLRDWVEQPPAKSSMAGVKGQPQGTSAAPVASDRRNQLMPVVKKYIDKLESLKPELEKLPFVKVAVSEVTKFLADAGNQKEIVAMVLQKSGGVFSFTASFIKRVFSLLLDVLLTLFFFSLILKTMADYCSVQQCGGDKKSEYLIRGIYNSKWFPGASEETLTRAREILHNIILKLKIWVRGYLTIILIESTLYTIMFFILGVPYALILGIIAGCTVLLPYIGPCASALLTLIVCLAAGTNASMLLLLAVILTYIAITGILDQLFIYPTVIGGALGLTTLETIIVVLLGGLFFGLTGMIFAVPTASVLKYLIPQIYNCWK